MKLYATKLSHFSRKVRLLLDHYGLQYEFSDIGNVADADAKIFNGNPLMSVPVLVDGGQWLIDSDNIAAYIVRKHDPGDIYGVLTECPQTLNARAVLNGIMSNEVKLILAQRTGVDTDPLVYFQKAESSIKNGLTWLEERADLFSVEQPGYIEFHLIALWDHLNYYEIAELAYPRLGAIAKELGSRDDIHKSAPHVLKPKT